MPRPGSALDSRPARDLQSAGPSAIPYTGSTYFRCTRCRRRLSVQHLLVQRLYFSLLMCITVVWIGREQHGASQSAVPHTLGPQPADRHSAPTPNLASLDRLRQDSRPGQSAHAARLSSAHMPDVQSVDVTSKPGFRRAGPAPWPSMPSQEHATRKQFAESLPRKPRNNDCLAL